MVELTLFGTVAVDGARRARAELLSGPKRSALVVYVAVEGYRHPVERQGLLGLLWPTADRTKRSGALRQILRSLREILGDALVDGPGGTICFGQGAVRCDVTEFRKALSEGRDKDALALYAGDFLRHIDYGCGTAWDAWVGVTREALRREACDAAWRRAKELSRLDHHREAIEQARRALAIRPFDERGVRQLMKMLLHVGDRASAVSLYQWFSTRLLQELGTEPHPETRRLATGVAEMGLVTEGPLFEEA